MTAALIAQRQRQVLIHAFIYYELNESIVTDAQYGRWWRELTELQRSNPQIAEQSPFWKHCAWISAENDTSYSFEGRGYKRDTYPPEIVNAAFRILTQAQRVPVAVIVRRYAQPKGGVRLPEPTAYPNRKPPQVGDRVVCTEIATGGTVEYVDAEHVWKARDGAMCRDAMRPIQMRLDRPFVSGKAQEPPAVVWRVGLNEILAEGAMNTWTTLET